MTAFKGLIHVQAVNFHKNGFCTPEVISFISGLRKRLTQERTVKTIRELRLEIVKPEDADEIFGNLAGMMFSPGSTISETRELATARSYSLQDQKFQAPNSWLSVSEAKTPGEPKFQGLTMNPRHAKRKSDTEYILLNRFAADHPVDVEGELFLLTELAPCRSCTKVIQDFLEKFKNIELTVAYQTEEREDRRAELETLAGELQRGNGMLCRIVTETLPKLSK